MNALEFAETQSSINQFTSFKRLLANVVFSMAGIINCVEAHSHLDELNFLQLFFKTKTKTRNMSGSTGGLTVEHVREAHRGPATPWLPGQVCGAAASGSL